jgi:hypothetical protein
MEFGGCPGWSIFLAIKGWGWYSGDAEYRPATFCPITVLPLFARPLHAFSSLWYLISMHLHRHGCGAPTEMPSNLRTWQYEKIVMRSWPLDPHAPYLQVTVDISLGW